MDTDSFVINIFTEDFFEDINNDVERWFDIFTIRMTKDHFKQARIKKLLECLKMN